MADFHRQEEAAAGVDLIPSLMQGPEIRDNNVPVLNHELCIEARDAHEGHPHPDIEGEDLGGKMPVQTSPDHRLTGHSVRMYR